MGGALGAQGFGESVTGSHRQGNRIQAQGAGRRLSLRKGSSKPGPLWKARCLLPKCWGDGEASRVTRRMAPALPAPPHTAPGVVPRGSEPPWQAIHFN